MAPTKISLYSLEGKKLDERVLTHLTLGENRYQWKVENHRLSGAVMLTIETPYEKATQKIMIEE